MARSDWNNLNHTPGTQVAGRSPCVDCKSRKGGCHGECAGYLKWKAALDAANAEIKRRRALL